MKVPARQSFAGVLLLGLALLAGGCSSFNREWKSAARGPGGKALAGRWEGKWVSHQNGHTGRLLCVLKRGSDTNYTAHFRATYWKIFRASYQVDFTGASEAGGWQFHGQENLGWFAGGVYRYHGRISPTNFFSTYECKYDQGTFELKPAPGNE
jgi:hypothetical protein